MKETQEFCRLLKTIETLRSDKGCPWDKKQTAASMIKSFLEEVYEFVDAVYSGDKVDIEEELGDVLLHVVFQAQIGREKRDFDMESVSKKIADKLIFRHPHVFGDQQAKDDVEVKINWEKTKQQEKKRASIFEGIPRSLAPLLKIDKVLQKAERRGFVWPDEKSVLQKIKEELTELEEAAAAKDHDQQHQKTVNELESESKREEEEFGDTLLALVSWARRRHLDLTRAAIQTTDKFKKRFQYIEKDISPDMSIEEKLKLWEKARQRT